MFFPHKPLFFLLSFIFFSCADDQAFLHNSIKRASDAIMIPCDPHELNVRHTCVVFASNYLQKLVIYDATAEEWVLAPNGFFPLSVRVGPGTHKLAKVTSADDKFPYLLALDQALPALFAVRAFADKNNRVFFTPQEQKLDKALRPFHIAAWQGDTHVFVLLSYRDDHSVGILALDPVTGIRDPQIEPVIIPNVGQKPGQIVIDAERNFALISDEGAPVLHKLDLTNIKDVLLNPAAHVTQINTGLEADKIYLQKRDFGDGLKDYVALLNTSRKELKLIDINNLNKISSSTTLAEIPQAAYFPDEKSAPCCDKNRHWLALADIKGGLFYYLIKDAQNTLSLEKASAEPVNLLLEKFFALSQLQLSTIIGGQVLVDPSLKKPQTCKPDNRKMFYIASFGADRPRSWTHIDAPEVEAQGYSCEGEAGAFRFGYKRE